MGALANFWNSERGLFAIVLVIAATVMACIGVIDFEAWERIVKWISGFYIGGKTLTGAIVALKNGSTTDPEPGAKTEFKA